MGRGSSGAGCWFKEGANCRDCKAGCWGSVTNDCRDLDEGEEV